jgi:integrase
MARRWGRTRIPRVAKLLTDRQLTALLQSPPTQRLAISDGAIDGLSIRVGPSGKPTWTYRFRIRGDGGVTTAGTPLNGKRHHRITLGRYPAMSLKAAREQAAHYARALEQGENPAELVADRAVSSEDTVAQLVDDYIANLRAEGIRSWRHGELNLRRHIVPAWADRPPGSIKHDEAQRLVDKVKAGRRKAQTGEPKPAPGAAREIFKWGRMMFGWAKKRRRIATNPFQEVDAPKPRKRQHFLTIEEARAVYAAAERLDAPWRTAFRLLMLTGCRENEVCGARWRWIDLESASLTIPAQHYKTNRAHFVPLTAAAVSELKALPRFDGGDYALSTTNGEKPIAGIHRKVVDQIHQFAEEALGRDIERFRLHDLRRTMRTHLPRLGVSEVVGELLLGHTLKGVQGTYNVYDFASERRQALDLWATELKAQE